MKIINIILLDESGSMQAIFEPTVSGCNEILQTIHNAASDPEMEQWLTLVSFNILGVKERIPLSRVTALPVLSPDMYQPNAATPLYDAMGFTFTRIRQVAEGMGDVQVHCSIITDGLENASQEYDHAAIEKLIRALREAGWDFVFIGADYDVEKVAMQIGIQSSIQYQRTKGSTSQMFRRESQEREAYYKMKKEDPQAKAKEFKIKLDDEGKEDEK